MAAAEAMMPVLTAFPSAFEGKRFDNVSKQVDLLGLDLLFHSAHARI